MQIIVNENLNKEETRKFTADAFRDGYIKTSGTDLNKILPRMSRFGGSNRDVVKMRIVLKLTMFFERYYGLGENIE